MISFYKRTIKEKELKKINNFEKGCWINIIDPTKKELDYLIEEFDLDEQNLLSGLDPNEIPRVEFDDKTVYVIITIISPANKEEVHTCLIIITNDFILTLCRNKPEFMNDIIEGRTEFITTQKLKCLLTLLSKINKEFEKETNSIVKLVSSKKKSIGGLNEKDMNILLQQENILNSFVSAYYHTNLLYDRIIKNIRFYEQDKDIIEDLIIEAKQGLDLCQLSLKTITNIRNHLEISLSTKLNKVITLLTTLTIFISVPAAVSGLYGMNIVLPFQEHNYIFYLVLLTIIMIWIGLLLYFRKIVK